MRPRALLIVMGWLVASACGAGSGSSSTSSSTLKIDFASADDAIGVFQTVGDGMVKGGPVAGVSVRRYDNKLDGAVAIQNADLMIQDHPDIIIDWNAVANVGAALGKKFNNAKIPCLAVNQPIPGCVQYNLSNMQMGVDAANVIVPIAMQRGWTSANTTILMSVASPNGVEVNDGPRYFYITIASKIPGFPTLTPDQLNPQTTKVGNFQGLQYECNQTVDGSYTNAKNLLPTIPAGNHVLLYGSDSDCSLGALRALTEAGRASNTLTCGLGPTPDGLTNLHTNASWVCEGSAFLEDWAEFIIAEAVAIHSGAKVPALTHSPQLMLTKATVDTYYNGPTIKLLPPLSKDAEYLKATGVLQKFKNVQGAGG
jgi:ribose transport system substrate-binding protein